MFSEFGASEPGAGIESPADDSAVFFYVCTLETTSGIKGLYENKVLSLDVEYLNEQVVRPGVHALEVRTTTRLADLPESVATGTVLITTDGIGPALFDERETCDPAWSESADLLVDEAESLIGEKKVRKRSMQVLATVGEHTAPPGGFQHCRD